MYTSGYSVTKDRLGYNTKYDWILLSQANIVYALAADSFNCIPPDSNA